MTQEKDKFTNNIHFKAKADVAEKVRSMSASVIGPNTVGGDMPTPTLAVTETPTPCPDASISTPDHIYSSGPGEVCVDVTELADIPQAPEAHPRA